ncbi:MAG: AAA family ATPase [Oscillospiraceae bacterium]|nr:AAA family ATPase [Oscillospiraceae bacterium]
MFSDLYIQGLKIHKDAGDNDSYIFGLPVVKNQIRKEQLPFKNKVTFFVGENGTGKSILLEAIAVSFGFNAEGGTRNFNFATEETHSDLCQYLTVCKGVKRPKDGFFLRAESFYNVASNIDKMDSEPSFEPKVIESYGGVSLHKQSHGESFMSLVLNRFGGNGVYILDEPEAALSPSRQMTLLAAIDSLVKNNSQFIIATHSPILMAYPDADIFVLTDDDISLTPYEETEHYTLTKQFLNNPQKMLKYLLEDKLEQ